MIQRNATNVTVSWIRAAIIILSFTLLHATADPSRGIQTEVPQPAPSAEHLTHGLAGLIHRYQTAAPEDQALLLSELTSAAVTRQQHLSALIETDPGAVLRVALPAHLRAGLPPEVQALVEEEVEEEGTLEVLHEDREQDSRYLYFLKTAAERLSLHFAADPPGLLTGTRIRAHGVRLSGVMALSSGSTSVTTLATIQSNTFGEQKTLLILVNFQDNPIQPFTVAYAQGVMFTDSKSVSNFYRENSYQQTWLSGDVVGWFTIPLVSTVCATVKTRTLAEQPATAAGANLSAYSRRVYAFPQNVCAWSGLGLVGGNPSWAMINGTFNLKVVGHELGHNFGDYHSHSMVCDPSGCLTYEYGDDHDIMGQLAAHLNAFQKERLGWLNYGVSPPVTIVNASGSYWMDAYEPPTAFPKALKILKATDPTTGAKTWYYLETRQKIGFDNDWNLPSGVILHTGSDADANSSYQKDLAPLSTTFDPLLDAGQSFSDSALGLTFTTISADSSGALVNVGFSSAACVQANPTVALSPSATQWVTPGAAVTYSVTVTNKDNSGCAASTFTLKASVPAGWTAGVGTSPLSLNPGASASTTLTVTSPASAASGFYTIGVTATNSAATSYMASISVTQSLSVACVPTNPILALSPSGTVSVSPGTAAPYTVTVTNKDNSGCAASTFGLKATVPAGWTGTFGVSSLTLSPGASAPTTLTVTSPATAAGGSYTIGVIATNSANTSFVGSASVTEALVTSLSITLMTDQASYSPPAGATLTATVTVGSAPAAGSSVTFTITRPDQSVITGTTATGANGLAVFNFRLKPKDPSGLWQVQAVATVNGVSGSSSTSIMVQ